MTLNEYDQLGEYLGAEPETPGEEMFFAMIWEHMSEEEKDKVRAIEL